MGYDLMTDEQEKIIGELREFQEAKLRPRIREIDENYLFPMDLHDELGKMGFHGMGVPKEYGGMGMDIITNCLVRMELGRVEAGFGYAYVHGKGAGGTIYNFGTEEQKKMISDFTLHGGIASSCLTEENAGSDLAGLCGEARKVGNEWVINAEKKYVLNGPYSQIYFVLAYTDKSKRGHGMSYFMVEADREGVTRGATYKGMGFHGCPTCDVSFKDVVVPADHLVGEENAGYGMLLSGLNRGRIVNMSPIIGIGQAAIDYAAEYAGKREQFGKTINKFQGVQFMLADMEMQVQASRQYMLYGAKLLASGKGKEAAVVCSGAKAFATEAVLKACSNAIQICGAVGYSNDANIEKLYRDARIFPIWEGTNQIQRMLIAKGL